LNREFMERMMGVRERLTDAPAPPGAGERSRDAGRLLRSVGRLWREHRRLEHEIAEFYARVNRSLAPVEQVNLDEWPADELAALYRRLESELLLHWRPPLVNDFFAMIWFGVLGRLVERWLPEAQPTLVNDLLVGEGGIISTEPARRVMSLAAMVAATPALHDAFRAQPDDDALLRQLRAEGRHAEFLAAFDAYLARFGDRCIGELKLETTTPSEDPGFIIRMTRAYVAQQQTDAARGTTQEATVRERAEGFVRERLSGARRRAFFHVLRHARARIRDRENLRFERTRVFGAVRRIFRGLGHRLQELGRLDHHRDVFHLTVEETFAAVAGTGVTVDLRPLVAIRRAEFERWEREPAPPDRFETLGPPVAPPPIAATSATAGDGDLQGLGCCPGIVRSPVRVVRDPSRAGDLQGHILVAERTDPGWTLLFPTASGLLVQRGSLLSHSAIVAREVGLPCVVAIPGLMDALTDGEWVEMNGASGSIRRIAAPEGRT
jgi:pyruvate,water dikinase